MSKEEKSNAYSVRVTNRNIVRRLLIGSSTAIPIQQKGSIYFPSECFFARASCIIQTPNGY